MGISMPGPIYSRRGPRRQTLDERSPPGTSGKEPAARARPIPYRGTVPADAVHRANLAALADRFARVVETADEIPD